MKADAKAMVHGGLIIESLTGDWPVYPGHPLVLAAAIIELFPDFAAANKLTVHGWSEALADYRVPGAGDHVGAAMHTLALGAQGASVDVMVQYANAYWDRGKAGGHSTSVEPGRRQAHALEHHFREHVKAWLAP